MDSWKRFVNKNNTGSLVSNIRLSRLYAVFFLLLFLSACVNYLQEADSAYLREDWDGAVSNYSNALAAAKEPVEIEHIKSRLAEAKRLGAQNHIQNAEHLASIGSVERAYQHALKANEYAANNKTNQLLKRLKVLERDRLVALGKAAFASRSWDSAIQNFERAYQADADPNISRLLQQAKSERTRAYAENFQASYSLAEQALYERHWLVAKRHYDTAHQFGGTDVSRQEAEFAVLMADAESYALQGVDNHYYLTKAEAEFEKARRYGIDVDYVDHRIEAVSLRDYKITIHGAVVLPFKPNSGERWDNIPMLGVDSKKQISSLAGFYGMGAGLVASLGAEVASVTVNNKTAPDCYLLVTVGEQVYGGEETTLRSDDYQPVWEYSLSFNDVLLSDDRVLSVVVTDADDFNDDDVVGTKQFVLGELVRNPGVHDIPLFDKRGALTSNGLLALTVSVEVL